VGGFVEGSVAGGAGVDACGGHVLVIFAGEGSFGAFFAEDAELFYSFVSGMGRDREWGMERRRE
jgi:hypothetical protein